MGRGWLLWAVVCVAVSGTPVGAAAQASVSSDDGIFEYTMSVDQLEYARFDPVHVSYAVHNITDTTQVMQVCCCGVEFFALRDSSCTLEKEGCEVAGCDACLACFEEGDVCRVDPCSPITLKADSSWVFTWDWSHEVCPNDAGADSLYGNVGTFRLVTGYHVCDDGNYENRLEMVINILKQVAVRPRSWGSLKTRHGGPADRVRPPR